MFDSITMCIYIYIYVIRFNKHMYIYNIYIYTSSLCISSILPISIYLQSIIYICLFVTQNWTVSWNMFVEAQQECKHICCIFVVSADRKISLDFSECLTAYVPEPLCRTYNPKHAKHLGFSNTGSCSALCAFHDRTASDCKCMFAIYFLDRCLTASGKIKWHISKLRE